MGGYLDDDDADAIEKPPNTRCGLQMMQYQFTADLIKKWWHRPPYTSDPRRILDAVELGILDRDLAVKFAAKNIGFTEAYLVRHGRPMPAPANPEDVRSYWRKLPNQLLSVAEKRLRDADCMRLRAMYPEGFEAVTQATQPADALTKIDRGAA